MPRKKPGTWDGKPNYRWIKMVKGKFFRVSCAELGLPKDQWTEQGSIKAAGEWMERILAEFIGKPPFDPINSATGQHPRWHDP